MNDTGEGVYMVKVQKKAHILQCKYGIIASLNANIQKIF